MNNYVSRGLYCALFIGGLSVLGATSAHAMDTTGEDSVLSGEQVQVSLNAPIDLTGNAVTVIGDSRSTGAAPEEPGSASEQSDMTTTSGDSALASGNQAAPRVAAPVDIRNNAVSIVGDSRSEGPPDGSPIGGAEPSSGQDSTTSGDDGVASGNQVMPQVEAPINVEANAVSVFGDTSAPGSIGTPAREITQPAPTWTDGGDASLAGNQASAQVAAPLTVNGNSLSVIGDSEVTGTDGSGSPHSTSEAGVFGTGGTGSSVPLLRSAQVLADIETSAESASDRSVTGPGEAQVNAASWRASGDSQAVGVLASTGPGSVGYGAGALLAVLITVGAVLVARRQAMRE